MLKKIVGIFFLIIILLVVMVLRRSESSDNLGITTNNNNGTSSENAVSKGAEPDISFELPEGYVTHLFADGLGRARDLAFSPGGTLLVSNPGRSQVIALPDRDSDGVADEKKVVVSGGYNVHGLAFYDRYLYVAEADKVVRYLWNDDSLEAELDKQIFDIPVQRGHTNRTITFDESGNLHLTIGSTCNVCNEVSEYSATVTIMDIEGNNPRVYASGLRNAAFTVFNNQTGDLWGTEMGRDLLGDNVPPDEINIIREGRNYGWPECYGNQVLDTSFSDTNSCRETESPIHEIQAHSAPLGLVFINSPQFKDEWQGDLFVAYHGSWNRSVPTGYKIVRLEVEGNRITGEEDFMTGFMANGRVLGRPVDVEFDSKGNLYVSDDRAGNVYIVQQGEN